MNLGDWYHTVGTINILTKQQSLVESYILAGIQFHSFLLQYAEGKTLESITYMHDKKF